MKTTHNYSTINRGGKESVDQCAPQSTVVAHSRCVSVGLFYLPSTVLMSLNSHVVALQTVIENKCGEGGCVIGAVKQRGGFVGHLEICSSLLFAF